LREWYEVCEPELASSTTKSVQLLLLRPNRTGACGKWS
jgi:hypothetical protein